MRIAIERTSTSNRGATPAEFNDSGITMHLMHQPLTIQAFVTSSLSLEDRSEGDR